MRPQGTFQFDDLVVPRERRFRRASTVIPKASATMFGFTKDIIRF